MAVLIRHLDASHVELDHAPPAKVVVEHVVVDAGVAGALKANAPSPVRLRNRLLRAMKFSQTGKTFGLLVPHMTAALLLRALWLGPKTLFSQRMLRDALGKDQVVPAAAHA